MSRNNRIIFWVIFAVLVLSYLLEFVVSWSATIPWLDIPLHILGGVWSGFFFFWFFSHLFSEQVMRHTWERTKIALVAVAFAALVGVVWEFHEFIFSQMFDLYMQQGIADTMKDLLMDIIGGGVASWWILYAPFSEVSKATSEEAEPSVEVELEEEIIVSTSRTN